MLDIELITAGKRFQYDWIFKNLTLKIPANSKCAVIGSNGSGKSTLLKSISGIQPLTEGKIQYSLSGKEIQDTDIYKYLVISAPYLELPEEFSLTELLDFHFKFKKPIPNMGLSDMIDTMYLSEHKFKPVSQFSSGMKQRLKIGLCLFSDCPLMLLDEPTSNLDQKGVNWYLKMIETYAVEKTVLVCSNEPKEYTFCDQKITMEDYKLRSKL
ncbi:ABC transporter, ATP-binding protein [Indibacter alkaliphilus LW1]|uniref:ABC transporter, ATP-binding protein n=1 Tax=Indibacter alkaliphilus (strain CCUG 57479 / KCTC 22604 / LW1) TaxID=1189612 RepID=S2DFK9_INDAL|nr:ATP-binding cassette domain-containing protein [Indibacter alkaliphilus]EOZ95845.1 ABC transporter, ATP-binding protein [Indibacter alkaliphilus LW1]